MCVYWWVGFVCVCFGGVVGVVEWLEAAEGMIQGIPLHLVLVYVLQIGFLYIKPERDAVYDPHTIQNILFVQYI